MIKLRWKDNWIEYTSVEWSGTENQASRKIVAKVPWNPYDSKFNNPKIRLGDLMYLYNGTTMLFVGIVISRDTSAEIGEAEYIAMDFMHYLLRSKATYVFRNTTAEKITQKICTEFNIKTKNLSKTKVNIKKIIMEDMTLYDCILKAYRKAKAKTKKKYMPVMNGQYVTVIEKGQSCNLVLEQGKNITEASYTDDLNSMINQVAIYNDNRKRLGQVQNKKNVSKYGVYQATYKKEEGADAKKEASALLTGISRTAEVECIGDLAAKAGMSIKIKDKATGLTGTFYITEDTHIFENGNHMMTLGLSWDNTMEGEEKKEEEAKPDVRNSTKCYYLENATVYHSKKNCTACKGKKTKTSTVAKMKKILITKGKNKGKRKYKPCAKCWET